MDLRWGDGRMRVVFLTASLPFGPGETFLIPEIRAVRNLGHEVMVVPVRPRGGIVHEAMREILPLTRAQGLVKAGVVAASLRELGSSGLALPAVVDFRRPGPSLRNVVGLPKALWVARLARRWRADHIHAYWGSVGATVAWVAARRTRIPWSFTMHRWDIYDDNLLGRKLQAALFARCIGRRGCATVTQMYPSAPAPRLLHLGIDIDVARATPRTEVAPMRLLVPAALIPRKGHPVLFRALGSLGREVERVDLAGDGAHRAELQRQVASAGLSRMVRFLGLVRHEELLRRMSSGEWDAVVLPSLQQGPEDEGIPVSLMEAMARGVPVIATDSGSTSELVTPGAGLLVPPGSVEELASAIRALARDPMGRRRLAERARRHVCAEFDARLTASALIDLIGTGDGS